MRYNVWGDVPQKVIICVICVLLGLTVSTMGTEVLDQITYSATYVNATVIRGDEVNTTTDQYVSVSKISSSDDNRIIPMYRIDKFINGSRDPNDCFCWQGGYTYTIDFYYTTVDSNYSYVTPEAVYLGDSYSADNFKPLSHYFRDELGDTVTISYVKTTPNILQLKVIITTSYASPDSIVFDDYPTNILTEMRYTGSQSQMELKVGSVTVQSDKDGTVYEREVLGLLTQIKANQDNYLQTEYDDALSRVNMDDVSDYDISDIGDISSIRQAFSSIISAISYDGTDCKWTFPASGDVPFIGSLWDEMEIDFSYWMEKIPDVILYCARFACMFSLGWWCVHELRDCIAIFGGDSD